MTRRVAIVGGGITGLAAAHALVTASSEAGTSIEVHVLEASPTIGGKLALGTIAGIQVDLGAESLLNTRPEAVALARAVGLGDAIVHPATSAARVLSRGQLRPLPAGLVMGAPSDPDAVAASGVLSAEAVDALRTALTAAPADVSSDVGIGAFVAQTLGREVADRIVDPILAGVYAGDADRISLRAAAPSLFTSLQSSGPTMQSVLDAARRAPSVPVFAGIEGGVGRLPHAVAAELRTKKVQIRTSTPVLALSPDRRSGWTLTLGHDPEVAGADAAGGPSALEVDAVILACPATATSQLLSTLPVRATPGPVFDAMRALDAIPYADVAVLTLAFDSAALHDRPDGSGFLVPTVEGRFVKAATFSSNKWAWAGAAADAADRFVMRASVGRFGHDIESLLEDDLVRRAIDDVHAIVPGLPAPSEVRVDRWRASLPQYLVGHLARVDAIRAGLAALPGLVVAGAAYDGIGIAACIASGQQAAADIVGATGHRSTTGAEL